MSGPLLSDNWYRMRQLRPRLRGHVRIHRHEYRGEVWYVIEDRMAAKHQRFNFQAYRVIDLMDGNRSMDDIWDALCADLAERQQDRERPQQHGNRLKDGLLAMACWFGGGDEQRALHGALGEEARS